MAKVIVVGAITQIGEVQEFGENGFKKKEVLVKTVEERPNVYTLEFTQDNTKLLQDFKEGDNVKITANLRGREYTKDDKYSVFMSLNAWKVEKV